MDLIGLFFHKNLGKIGLRFRDDEVKVYHVHA
jgi:hypothetical protein